MKNYIFSIILIMSHSYAMEYKDLSPLHKMLHTATILDNKEDIQLVGSLLDDNYSYPAVSRKNYSPHAAQEILKQYSDYLNSLAQETRISSWQSEVPFDYTESVNPIEKENETLSSGSESVSNGDEEEHDSTSRHYAPYTQIDKSGTITTQEPIEAFFRRICPECSATIASPLHVIPEYKKHWKEKHPHQLIQYSPLQKPTIFYTLFTRCPRYGGQVTSKRYKGGTCNHTYDNVNGTLEHAFRIAEFMASHYDKIHNKKIKKEDIRHLLEITRKQNKKNDSLQNKKRKIN